MEHTLLTNGFLRCSIALTFDVLLYNSPVAKRQLETWPF